MADFFIPWGGNLPRLFIDRNGDVMGGGRLCAYKARTTTPIDMYDGIDGDLIGKCALIGDGGYIERDQVQLTSTDTVVDVLAGADEGGGGIGGTISTTKTGGVIAYANDGAQDFYLLMSKIDGSTLDSLDVLGGSEDALFMLTDNDGNFYIINAEDDHCRKYNTLFGHEWTSDTFSQPTGELDQAVVAPGGPLYLVQGSDIVSFDLSDGNITTFLEVGKSVDSIAAGPQGDLWITGTPQGGSAYIQRVTPAGSLVWETTDHGIGTIERCQVDTDSHLYAVSASHKIARVDETGDVVWTVQDNTSLQRNCVVRDGFVYTVKTSTPNQVEQRSTTDGAVVATFEYDEDSREVADRVILGETGFLYATTEDGGPGREYLLKIDVSDMSLVFVEKGPDIDRGEICFRPDAGTSASNWQQLGNSLSVPGALAPTIAALDGTRVAFFDRNNEELRTYSWDGTDWSQVGNGLTISGASDPEIAALDSTSVAYFDSGNDELRTYSFDGTDWSQSGNALEIPAPGDDLNNLPAIAALDSTHVAYIDTENEELRTYSWNGTDWSQVGNGLPFDENPNTINTPSLAALNSTDVAFFNTENSELRAYSWDGTDWAQVGNSLTILGAGNVESLAALNSTDLAFIDTINNELRTYRFDGTDWFQVGDGLTISLNTAPVMSALSSTKIAFYVGGADEELRTYGFS